MQSVYAVCKYVQVIVLYILVIFLLLYSQNIKEISELMEAEKNYICMRCK